MRIIATVLISVATFFTLNSLIPTANEYEIYDSCVRLHVLANSNSEEDQKVKLKVRDRILSEISTYELKSKEQALKTVEENKKKMEELAREELEKNGFDYDVKIDIGLEDYPTRNYEDFSLPSGTYTSVRVLLGDGEGENWWCVLYPPLCTASAIKYDDEACVDVGLTKDQYSLITQSSGKYKVKFKILELTAGAIGIKY